MSTRTSDRYPETLANRSASSKASRLALLWRCWATVARRGRTTSTHGGLSAFVEFTGDGDADRRQSATMLAAPTPTATNKTFMPVLMIFIVFRLQDPFWLFVYSAATAWCSARPSSRSDTVASRGSGSE